MLVVLSFLEPSVITPTAWNDQINHHGDVEPPWADKYQHFDTGDIVYIEGDIISINFLSGYDKTVIKISDNKENSSFSTTKNITNINLGDHVFLKIKIIEPGTSGSSFILSGESSSYFSEEAILVDIEKDYFSAKFPFMVLGILLIVIGIYLINLYFSKMRKVQDEKEETEEGNQQNDGMS
jgi:hypothetical protein